MNHQLLPSLPNLGGGVLYLWGNPALFVHQTTVSTATLGMIILGLHLGGRRIRQLRPLLAVIAPTVVVISVIVAVGVLALATEIFLRFYWNIDRPSVVATQFLSGIGHFVLFGSFAWILRSWWISASKRARATARMAAGLYLCLQVQYFEPPWFSFQGQRELVLGMVWLFLLVFTGLAALNLAGPTINRAAVRHG